MNALRVLTNLDHAVIVSFAKRSDLLKTCSTLSITRRACLFSTDRVDRIIHCRPWMVCTTLLIQAWRAHPFSWSLP
jgi:hypothetical protein